ncbi:uncharacterized protein LOC141612250 [Silene latifolia]|uniref:uncharacterized protein LOC141612250 n=1 Tax=Silene latifolia TaxID=37657 RepID=UPI003D77F056
MGSEKKFRCCCGLKFVNHDGAISHAESRHRDSDFYICDTRKCLAVVTVKVKGVKHRHDFGQAVAESSCTGGSVVVAECSGSGDMAECSRSGEITESSADVAECSGPNKRGKSGKK